MFETMLPLACGDIKNPKKMAKLQNNMEMQATFFNLLNLALDTFEWKGLPTTCNKRFLELTLLLYGKACIVNDKNMGFMSLRCTQFNQFNIYGDFDKINAYGWTKQIGIYNNFMEGTDNQDTAEAVVCRDNEAMFPYYMYLMQAAERLSSNMRSIDTASYLLKLPYIIQGTDEQVDSIKTLFNEITLNVPVIPLSKDFNVAQSSIINTNQNSGNLQSLWDNQRNLQDKISTLLGINNSNNTDKKERLITDEINSNNALTSYNLQMRLRSREKFVEQCKIVWPNEMKDLSVEVKHKPLENNEEKGENDDDFGLQDTNTVNE